MEKFPRTGDAADSPVDHHEAMTEELTTYVWGWSANLRRESPRYLEARDENHARRLLRETTNVRTTRGVSLVTLAEHRDEMHRYARVEALRCWDAHCREAEAQGREPELTAAHFGLRYDPVAERYEYTGEVA